MSKGDKPIAVVAVFGACIFVGLAGALALGGFEDDLTVREVATLAQQDSTIRAAAATERTVDGIGFPDWSRWGWKATGGRADHPGRDVKTVFYEKGGKAIRYSIVAGTSPVNWDFNGRPIYRSPPEGKVELLPGWVDQTSTIEIPGDCGDGPCVASSGAARTVTRKINDRTVVLTVTPPTDAVSQEAQDMALRTKR